MAKVYAYKGWQFRQICRGNWEIVRMADGFHSYHNTLGGCQAFVRLHGTASNPDAAYQASL